MTTRARFAFPASASGCAGRKEAAALSGMARGASWYHGADSNAEAGMAGDACGHRARVNVIHHGGVARRCGDVRRPPPHLPVKRHGR
jgi:hypothetical protein